MIPELLAIPRLEPLATDGHKGDAGRVWIVGASPGLTGAVTLAALAAGRSGAGLVTCVVPRGTASILEVKTTAAMTRALPETATGALAPRAYDAISLELSSIDGLVIGPGMGRDPLSRELVLRLLDDPDSRPCAVDADGLWHLAALDPVGLRLDRVVLTPHLGELRRLLGQPGLEGSPRELADHSSVREFVDRTRATLVLKGAETSVLAPDLAPVVVSSGNPGLATGGSGDVLSGVLGAFLARFESVHDAAVCATWIHGRAADFAAYGGLAEAQAGRLPAAERARVAPPALGELGLQPEDVIKALPQAILELQAAPRDGQPSP